MGIAVLPHLVNLVKRHCTWIRIGKNNNTFGRRSSFKLTFEPLWINIMEKKNLEMKTAGYEYKESDYYIDPGVSITR